MGPAPSRRGELASRLGLGALVFLVAAGVFATVAAQVAAGQALTRLDVELAHWLRANATPELTAWMLAVTHLHSTFAVSCYATLAGVVFALRRAWLPLATVFFGIAGGLMLNLAMKLAFQRARPVVDDPLLTLATYSFPSGHVVGTTLMYGLLVLWAFARTRHPLARVVAVLGAAAMIGLVAFTRMYLGVHYLSDVVAGAAEGVAWLAICLTALAAFRSRLPARPHPATGSGAHA
jgi:membrane-associated phospholipid phosphatase